MSKDCALNLRSDVLLYFTFCYVELSNDLFFLFFFSF